MMKLELTDLNIKHEIGSLLLIAAMGFLGGLALFFVMKIQNDQWPIDRQSVAVLSVFSLFVLIQFILYLMNKRNNPSSRSLLSFGGWAFVGNAVFFGSFISAYYVLLYIDSPARNNINIDSIVILIILNVVVVGLVFSAILIFRHQLLQWLQNEIFKTPANEVSMLIEKIREGDEEKSNEAKETLMATFYSTMIWLMSRGWISVFFGILFAGGFAVVGEYLISKQNDIMKEQNEYFKDQIRNSNRQFELKRRTELGVIIFDKDKVLKNDGQNEVVYKYPVEMRSIAFIEYLKIGELRKGLDETILRRVNMDGAFLMGLDFSQKDISGASFLKADMFGSIFSNTKIEEINFTDTVLSHSYFESVSFRKVESIRGADLSGVSFFSVDFGYKFDFSAAGSFERTEFVNSNLSQSDFSDAVLNEAMFDGVSVDHSNFTNAKIEKASFIAADLKGAVFAPESLEGVDFTYADLRESRFLGVKNYKDIKSILNANIFNMDAPQEFIDWAKKNGAIEEEFDRYKKDEFFDPNKDELPKKYNKLKWEYKKELWVPFDGWYKKHVKYREEITIDRRKKFEVKLKEAHDEIIDFTNKI